MEGAANSNAGLMRRIVQLETEKNELQQDIEALCMQQSGFSNSNNILSRMQAQSSLCSKVDVMGTEVTKAISRSLAHLDIESFTIEGLLDQLSKQSCRTAGFEQELEACKQKLALHSKENLNLQEELAETLRAKGRVADAFKAAMDKNKELEKEVKFYQSRMAGAFTERDKAVLEVERVHTTEKTMAKELRELRHRSEQINGDCCELEKNYTELQKNMEIHLVELKRVQKVVEKFWQLRQSGKENGDLHEELLDRAQILLEDSDGNWVYGLVSGGSFEEPYRTAELALAEVNEELTLSKDTATKLEKELTLTQSTSAKLEDELALLKSASTNLKDELLSKESALRKLEEELELAKATSMDLKLQLEAECLARTNAEEKNSIISDQLALNKYCIERDLQKLRSQHITLRTMVSACLEVEKREVSLARESLQHLLDKLQSKAVKEVTGLNLVEKDDSVVQDVLHNRKGLRVHFEDEGASQGTSSTKEEIDIMQHNIVNIEDDSRKILAQALQEKVEALLLLSQQEERYYLEASTQSALESQITMLNKNLAQVTGEKVKALMELAEERQQIQQLQDKEREVMEWLEQQKIAYPGRGMILASRSEARLPSLPGGTSISQPIEGKAVARSKQLFTASGGYLKGWLRGLDISSYKTTTSSATSSISVADGTPSSKTDSGNSVARLLVENAALQERVASIQHLAKSAHQLRMILVKVAGELQSELAPPSIQSAIAVVESVKSEAKQLAAAVGSALPVSFQGALESSLESSYIEPSSEEILEGNSNRETDGTPRHDSVSMARMEITELLLAVAELQTQSLLARLNLASTDD